MIMKQVASAYMLPLATKESALPKKSETGFFFVLASMGEQIKFRSLQLYLKIFNDSQL